MVSSARSSISEGCRSRDSLSTLITGPSASATSAVLELLSQMRSTDGDSVVFFPTMLQSFVVVVVVDCDRDVVVRVKEVTPAH